MILSETQQNIYNDVKDALINRLERVLEISKSPDSKEAFFFVLAIAITKNQERLEQVADLFYKADDYRSIKNLFIQINRLAHKKATQGMYYKSIVDPRFFSNSSPEYNDELLEEFAKQLLVELKAFMSSKAPEGFLEKKLILLCVKYSELINLDEDIAAASPASK